MAAPDYAVMRAPQERRLEETVQETKKEHSPRRSLYAMGEVVTLGQSTFVVAQSQYFRNSKGVRRIVLQSQAFPEDEYSIETGICISDAYTNTRPDYEW